MSLFVTIIFDGVPSMYSNNPETLVHSKELRALKC